MTTIHFGHREHRDRRLDPPRPLTDGERQLLNLIVGASGEDVGIAVIEQASKAMVATDCLSCPTIGLVVPSGVPPVLELTGARMGGVAPVMLSAGNQGDSTQGILHIVDGYLTELEFFRDDAVAVSGLPDPHNIVAKRIR